MGRRSFVTVVVMATGLLVTGLLSAPSPFAVQPAGALGTTRFVAPGGSDTSNNCATRATPCATVGHGLDQALPHDTVQLEPGTYRALDDPFGQPNVIASEAVTVQSDPVGGTAANTIIDATGTGNGIYAFFGGTVKNLTIRNANRYGINTSQLESASVAAFTVTGSVITDNDQCRLRPTAPECTSQLSGVDIGAGIHLEGEYKSVISGNTVTGNYAGILVTDSHGLTTPADRSTLIEHNTVSHNLASGITLRSIDPDAVLTGVGLTGVSVHDNIADANGGAGILVSESGLGSLVSVDSIAHNEASDNGLPGITFHTPSGAAPVIQDNTLRNNGLHGGSGSGPGDAVAGVARTAGILVYAAPSGVTAPVITGNTISGAFYGIWLSADSARADISGNTIAVDPGGTAIFIDEVFTTGTIGIARTPSGHGYWVAQQDGAVFPFGDAGYFGGRRGNALAASVVGIAATPTGRGYWLVGSDGGIFAFGDAGYFGSTGALRLNRPIVGMAATTDGRGYWLVASDGGIFSFGTAAFHGSTGALRLNRPIVGMATGPDGRGYWLVASDGGIFSFGGAAFHGSTGALRLNRPIVGMATGPGDGGYWLVASDGGIFSFGGAAFHGSTGALRLVQPIVGMAATLTGLGYWLTAADGGIFAFPDAPYLGSVPRF